MILGNIVHGLWIGNELSALEQLCIYSFIRNGHTFHLWAYDKNLQVPENAVLRDANEIIPFEQVFSYSNTNKFGHGKGSYAGFSDIFRYKLLYLQGGWWTDMDITCLQPLAYESEYVFRKNGNKGVVGNLMKCPKGSRLMHDCFVSASEKINSGNKDWMLPIRILNDGIHTYQLDGFIHEFTNEDNWVLITRLLTGNMPVPAHWKAIHWMNEEWRRNHLVKNKFMQNSLIQGLMNKHHIPHALMDNHEIRSLRYRLSKWNYRLINLKARINWLFR